MYNITPIKNYILYLKKQCNLSITLHIDGIDNIVIPSDLISFNIHDNSYCVYIKTCPNVHEHCINKQGKVLQQAKTGSFCGVCHAGVKEYVYPIENGEITVGFISVSGYKCENYKQYIDLISEKYGMPKPELLSYYKSLKDEIPPKELVDSLVIPLCNMLELAYIKSKGYTEEQESFCDEVVAYIKKNHNGNISSSDICKVFSCSRSMLSRKFNKVMGVSIRQYINNLRIEDAKSLLEHSDLTVTEIAYSVGFSDSNYFTDVFKRIVGVTPSKFKKEKSV